MGLAASNAALTLGRVITINIAMGSANPMTVPISVLVLTYNEQANIESCLKSVRAWADDIRVLDSGSKDRTLSTCAAFGVVSTFHPYVDHRSQMNWGITQMPWRHDWLLLLDADNVVTSELKREIEAMLANDDPAVKELQMKAAGTQQFEWDNAERIKLAKKDAALRCLRARGLAPKGGVERPRPR